MVQNNSSTMESQLLQVQNREVRIWRGGSGPTLLLLHAGYGDAEFSWKFVWEQLARHFTVIAPDLPGFGETALERDENASTIADLLAAIGHHLVLGKMIVVGNSFGAAAGYRLAQEHSEVVERLILVNGSAIPVLPDFARRALQTPPLHDAFVHVGRQMIYSERALRGAFRDIESIPAGFVERLHANAAKNSVLSTDIWLRTEPNRQYIEVPLGFVWGADDRMVPASVARKMMRKYPRAAYHGIAGARHMPEIEEPHAFTAAIVAECSRQ